MKATGIVLFVFGSLMVISSLNLMATRYDMSQSHDVSKALGGLGVSFAVAAMGINLIKKSKSSR